MPKAVGAATDTFKAVRTTKGAKATVTVLLNGTEYHKLSGARAARATHLLVVELPEAHPMYADRGAYPIVGGGMGLRTGDPGAAIHGKGTRYECHSFSVPIEEG